MTVETTPTSVVHSLDVAAPAAHAFEIFTRHMASWWEPTHHLLDDVVDMRVEPYAGGRIVDVAADGTEQSWSRVLAYDPPRHFAFSWDISLRWEIEADPERCSEVHVTFEAVDEASTRVVLEHRHLERHGAGWEGMRSAVGGSDGWPRNLARYADVAAG